MARLRPLFAEHPPVPRLAAWPAYRWLVVGTVCLGAFLGQLDASIAGLVLPTLEDVFNAPVASVEWVALAYLLTLAALVVPLGRLADLLGRKMLYIWGFVIFIAGSALCGTASALGALIASPSLRPQFPDAPWDEQSACRAPPRRSACRSVRRLAAC